MLTSPFATGSPNWLDLATPDLEGAEAFYRGVLGWDFRSAGPEAGGYGMFQLDGRTVAGGMTVAPEQGPPAWTLYFKTSDADATAAAVRAAGGAVALAPMDVFEMGRMAVFTDPEGVGFAVWQPGTTEGLDTVNAPGSLCWVELYTPDPDAAITFYRSVFGTETTTTEVPDDAGAYTMLNPAGQGAEAMFGGVVPLDADPVEAADGPSWLPYFEVEDVDRVGAEAERLGGSVRLAPLDMDGVGRIAKLTDPYGARFAVIRTAPRED